MVCFGEGGGEGEEEVGVGGVAGGWVGVERLLEGL